VAVRSPSVHQLVTAALVNVEMDSLAALGCIVNGIPMVTDMDQDPFAVIRTGDHAK